MNRYKIFNRLSHDCHSSVHSKFNDKRFVVSMNVNNARFYRTPLMTAKSTSLTFLIAEKRSSTTSFLTNDAINPKKCGFSSSDPFGRFFVSGGLNDHKLFRPRNSILAASAIRVHSYRSVRSFSDASNTAGLVVSKPPQLPGIWCALSESLPVELCQNSLVWLHNTTGLPWWATIVITAWTIKLTIGIPLALYQSYVAAKFAQLKPEMDKIVEQLKMETNYGMHKYKWTESEARQIYNRSVKKQLQMLVERDNCHPLKRQVLIVVQLPIWIVLSASIRNLCYMLPYPTERAQGIYVELMTGGFGWIENLTVADHYYALPIALGLMSFTLIEIQNLMKTTEWTTAEKFVTNFIRAGTVGIILLTTWAPAGIGLYWTSNAAFGIVQNLLLMSPKVRRLAGIPMMDNELAEPYKHLYSQLRRKIGVTDDSSPKIGRNS